MLEKMFLKTVLVFYSGDKQQIAPADAALEVYPVVTCQNKYLGETHL